MTEKKTGKKKTPKTTPKKENKVPRYIVNKKVIDTVRGTTTMTQERTDKP